MASTFGGLEIAKRALFTQQSAIYTTSHNISNANTPGYSRQRVNMQTVSPFPAASRNRPEIPGQIGQGVEAGTVQRIRDDFVDMQFRTENTKLGYWEARANALSQMEQILNEPSDTGLSSVLNQFWEALNILSVNPEDTGARAVVQQRGQAVAETFNYISDSLTAIQMDLESELNVSNDNINALLSQIQGVNNQIKAVEPHGYLPNDLYDERDKLIDELSKYVNIEVDYESSGGQALDIAQGIANIRLVDADGNPQEDAAGKDISYLITKDNEVNNLYFKVDKVNGQSAITEVRIGAEFDESGKYKDNTGVNVAPIDFIATGKIKGLIESHGYQDGNKVEGLYTKMLADVDKMAYTFAKAFNLQHAKGFTLEGVAGEDFFDLQGSDETSYIGYAAIMDISQTIKDSADNIAASMQSDALGNGQNAINLANIKDKVFDETNTEEKKLFDLLGKNTSVESFYESIIGNMAVQAQEANRMQANAQTLSSSVESRRQSISGVSLDEEMTNLITFQHAYNAAARSLTVVDEMLDRIINQMGLVGR